jgi:hypothetical protein
MRPKLHYDWHWDFNTGNGDMGNQGIHQMDIARWFLGHDTISHRVLSIGGRLGYEDAGDTPNTQTVIHDYPNAPIIFETRGLPKAKKFQANVAKKDKNYWDRNMDDYRGSRIGVIVQCENGYVVVPSYTEAKAYDNDNNELKSFSGGGDHYANFLDAVATNDQSKLNGPVLEGHLSSALCHTGGVSHQLGQELPASEIESSLSGESQVFKDSFSRMRKHLAANGVEIDSGKAITLGKTIEFNVQTEMPKNDEKASAMMSREYRVGHEVPNLKTKAAS